MKQKKVFLSLLICCLLGLFGGSAFAEKTSETQGMTENEKRVGFTVQAVLPENQINDRISYYHLLVQPGGTQTIEVKIFNSSNEKQTYQVEVIRAATNKNGLITYDERDKPADKSMKMPITNIAKPKNKEVSVEAFSEGKAEIDINVPTEPFSGITLGGIRISLKSDGKDESEQGMSVKNTYGYAIGMVLTENADQPIYGETELKLTAMNPEIDYGSKVLEASIQNPHPEAMEKLEAEGKITKKGSDKVIAKHSLKNVKIAPNFDDCDSCAVLNSTSHKAKKSEGGRRVKKKIGLYLATGLFCLSVSFASVYAATFEGQSPVGVGFYDPNSTSSSSSSTEPTTTSSTVSSSSSSSTEPSSTIESSSKAQVLPVTNDRGGSSGRTYWDTVTNTASKVLPQTGEFISQNLAWIGMGMVVLAFFYSRKNRGKKV